MEKELFSFLYHNSYWRHEKASNLTEYVRLWQSQQTQSLLHESHPSPSSTPQHQRTSSAVITDYYQMTFTLSHSKTFYHILFYNQYIYEYIYERKVWQWNIENVSDEKNTVVISINQIWKKETYNHLHLQNTRIMRNCSARDFYPVGQTMWGKHDTYSLV